MFEKIMSMFKSTDKPKKEQTQHTNKTKTSGNSAKPKVQPTRIGELGEHKINIQLDQLPKGCKYLSDLMVENSKSRTGYSQIDHVVITPQGCLSSRRRTTRERLREQERISHGR